MNTPKFTPGKWQVIQPEQVQGTDEWQGLMILDGSRRTLAEIFSVRTTGNDIEPQANARLIAEAPAQHGMLVEALDLVPRISDDDPMAPALAEWCRNVRALLAKIDGAA